MKHAALAALVLLAACATAEGGGNGSATPLGDLTGSEWTLLNETRSATPPTIAFAADRASGFAGCNRWFASVSRTDQALDFDAIGTTRMMCPPPAMEAERAFTSALENTHHFRVENGELVLADSGGADVARFRRTN